MVPLDRDARKSHMLVKRHGFAIYGSGRERWLGSNCCSYKIIHTLKMLILYLAYSGLVTYYVGVNSPVTCPNLSDLVQPWQEDQA